jgi:hypothetical protein
MPIERKIALLPPPGTKKATSNPWIGLWVKNACATRNPRLAFPSTERDA